MSVNLLRNWTFCDGMHVQDGIPQIGVPDEWRLDWLDNQPFHGIAPGLVACRPESVVVDLYSVSPDDQQAFFYLNGESTRYVWKIFKGGAPMYAACSQEVTGLVPGRAYRFTMWTYADIVASYVDGKHFSDDIWAAEARAGVSDVGIAWAEGVEGPLDAITWANWHNVSNDLLAFGAYRPVTVAFVAEAASVKVWFEVKAKWGLPNNGWWLWGATLVEVADESPAPPAPGDPLVIELGPETQALLRQIFAVES